MEYNNIVNQLIQKEIIDSLKENKYKNIDKVIGGLFSAMPLNKTILLKIEEEFGTKLKEGHKKQIVVNAYERNIEARNRCLAYYRKLNNCRIRCEVCGFDFGKIYGKEFEGKIHIHHLKEISLIGEEYEIDAEKDLIPICPNCHMVAHSRKPEITPEEIRDLLED